MLVISLNIQQNVIIYHTDIETETNQTRLTCINREIDPKTKIPNSVNYNENWNKNRIHDNKQTFLTTT